MILAVRIKLVVAETPEVALPGVKLSLYDRDQQSMDDFLGTGVTNENGECRIVFDSDAYTDEEDRPLWRLDSLPDLYVMVYNAQGEVLISTRKHVEDNNLPQLITIGVPEELAIREGLIL
jgi:hypothetical protein